MNRIEILLVQFFTFINRQNINSMFYSFVTELPISTHRGSYAIDYRKNRFVS